jgi:hypothetical protein
MAHIINLSSRPDRWEAFQKNWKGFPVIREEAIQMENVYHAVFLKHRELLEQAKARGETHILIMEDDAVPVEDWKHRWETQLKPYLDAREDWEVFNGGMLSIRDCVQRITRLGDGDRIQTFLLDVNRGCMAHFLYFNINPALEKMKDWEAEGKPEFDAWYAHKLKCVACIPYLAIQSDGKSDAANGNREWENRFKHESVSMLFALREFM